ncbi:hypothetical protein [Nocardiopsis halophila]|uniref:hypothetical protein n=1 Tax=Nocardiopsis halophila TaxID=141692 RepID=UPI0003490439|nr:hypothetical protein [Nocardiopsis halophila]
MSSEAPAEGRRRQCGRRGDLTRFGAARTVRGRDTVHAVRTVRSAVATAGAGRAVGAVAPAESGAEG